jgi:hypothetical protein
MFLFYAKFFLFNFLKLLIKTTNLYMLVGTCNIPMQITDLWFSRVIYQALTSHGGASGSNPGYCERNDIGACFLVQTIVLPLLYNHLPPPPVACDKPVQAAHYHMLSFISDPGQVSLLPFLIAKCTQIYRSYQACGHIFCLFSCGRNSHRIL